MHYTAEFLTALRALGVSPPVVVVGRGNVPSHLALESRVLQTVWSLYVRGVWVLKVRPRQLRSSMKSTRRWVRV